MTLNCSKNKATAKSENAGSREEREADEVFVAASVYDRSHLELHHSTFCLLPWATRSSLFFLGHLPRIRYPMLVQTGASEQKELR